MKFASLLLVLSILSPAVAFAQGAGDVLPPEIQIAAAVAPLAEEFRDAATVLGYSTPPSGLVTLREGPGPFICLADDPADERFHAACYHRSLEPFMARGRELRAQGFTTEVDSLRDAEVIAGTLPMPEHPAALYSLTGTLESLNPATGEVSGARELYVIYVPFATAELTGLSTRPQVGRPWLMSAGTPKAHIMFVPSMH
jgi:hypothetical protein